MKADYSLTAADDSHEEAMLSRYLAGKLCVTDAKALESSMSIDKSVCNNADQALPGDWLVLETAFQFVHEAAMSDVSPPDVQPVLDALKERMDVDTAARSDKKGPVMTYRSAWITSVVITVAALVAVYTGKSFLGQSSAPASIHAHEGQLIYSTLNGQRSVVTLPDGSKVSLNVASRLELPSDFNTSTRTIYLNGEAQFDVVANTSIPFVVLTRRSAVRVLGTTFTVREYISDTLATVNVQSGEIAVQSGDAEVQNVVVSGNQQVTLNSAGMVRLSVSSPAASSFTEGILTLHKLPLKEAIVELSRWYDVDIYLGGESIGQQKVTGKFAMGSLDDLIGILEMAFDVHVVRDGRVLTLYSE